MSGPPAVTGCAFILAATAPPVAGFSGVGLAGASDSKVVVVGGGAAGSASDD